MEHMTVDPSASYVDQAMAYINMGGPALWSIFFLSILTLSLILWKAMRLISTGAWSGQARAERAVRLWKTGDREAALKLVAGRRPDRLRLAHAAMLVAQDDSLTDAEAEAEVTRVAKDYLASTQAGLRGLELAAILGPLLGLLGTVTGMIASFKALQSAGANADPATLAGGIWELLLTTASGMAVAIPAQIALTWYESVADKMGHDMEGIATRLLARRNQATEAARPTLAFDAMAQAAE